MANVIVRDTGDVAFCDKTRRFEPIGAYAIDKECCTGCGGDIINNRHS